MSMRVSTGNVRHPQPHHQCIVCSIQWCQDIRGSALQSVAVYTTCVLYQGVSCTARGEITKSRLSCIGVIDRQLKLTGTRLGFIRLNTLDPPAMSGLLRAYKCAHDLVTLEKVNN